MDSGPFPYDQFPSPDRDDESFPEEEQGPRRSVSLDVKIAAGSGIVVASLAVAGAWALVHFGCASSLGCDGLAGAGLAVFTAFGVVLGATALLWQTLKMFSLAYPGWTSLATLATLVLLFMARVPVFRMTTPLFPRVVFQVLLVALVTVSWTVLVDRLVNRSWNPPPDLKTRARGE